MNGLWLHRPCVSTHRWTLMDLSVDGERDYGQFMVVFVHFSADCSSDPPLDWVWPGWPCWDRPPLEVYRVSAGMLGDWHLAKSYTRSLFPLSTETPRGSYLRKHSIPVCAVKQYSTATTQRVHTCNTTRLSNQQVSECVKTPVLKEKWSSFTPHHVISLAFTEN